nr:hypothetical protein [Tanacetum cinerariifolium]
DSDDRSDKDSEETVKSGAGKDSDEDDEENDDEDDEEEETAKDDKETEEKGKGVKRKAMMRRSMNQDLMRRQEYEKKKTLKNYIVTIILENLPTFNSAFRFEERLRLLEVSFNEYRQTNQVAGAVSAIPGIVH